MSVQGRAQLLDREQKQKPDSLTLADRFALRTNSVDWLMLMPNITAEFDLGSKNHNHWSLGLGLRYNWQTTHDFKPAWVYNLAEVRGELRYYWHTQKINKDYNINPHEKEIVTDDTIYTKKKYLGRLFSTRRYEPKHLNTTYYRGAYVSADKYSFLFGGKSGHQGTAVIAGFLYGIVKPLYEFKDGNTLDLDLGFNLGVCMTKYDKYYNDRESDCYPVLAHRDWRPVMFPLVSELRFAFIYRFGTYPLTKKYRWKIDVDAKYREEQQAIADSIRKVKNDRESLIKEIRGVREAFDKYYKEALASPKVQEATKTELEQIRKKNEQALKDKQADEARKLAEKEAKKNKPSKVEKVKEPKASKKKGNKAAEVLDSLNVPVASDVQKDSVASELPPGQVSSGTVETSEDTESKESESPVESENSEKTPVSETPEQPEQKEEAEE